MLPIMSSFLVTYYTMRSLRQHITVRALCRYDALLKNVTELHTLLHNAVLNNWRGLPDSPGIQMLLEEMQVDVNRYYEIHDELNAEIEEAVAMLKSVKRWTIVKYHAKWASSGLVLGAGSYGLMCYKTGSWLDWRSWGLGGTVIAVTIAIGLYKLNSPKEQAKVCWILLFVVNVIDVFKQKLTSD